MKKRMREQMMENGKAERIRRMGVWTYCILAAAVLGVLCINQKITRTVESASGPAYEQKVDSVAFGYCLEQPFEPQHEYLDALWIYVDTASCSRDTGELQVRILDEGRACLFHTGVPVSQLPLHGWVELQTDVRLPGRRTCAIEVESVGCVDFGPRISFFDAELAATAEQQGHHLTYAGMDVTNSALRIKFVYAVPVAACEYLVYYLFGLMAVLLVFRRDSPPERL